ncbi:sensor domain-containing diguanylate cyclase [Peloplasma aerotolerans]|uniref:Sensor domain-containing diguanylate cyclase n=1 Tax=Peloplasma aerotolerans TaxID=3044389 RepID=A0AAW6U7J8_9MOLU|nr:sensor domain-containing diguanylate cyclase [Mariniplasma sp. M4Ah]MDI6452750.1 sensor domain-containing diguanylate cyclase [Mariniplasma sp. M4Ah]
MNKTYVYLREFNEQKNVEITDDLKPKITDEIQSKWQNIMNVIADILNVPAGLIMKITKTDMEVFIKSSNLENPYPADGKDQLGHGLYCETVIGTDQQLIVENALNHKQWKDNPDVALNMISYFGLPIKWHDGEVFGTICVLNNQEHKYSKKHQQLLNLFKEAIESDLHNLHLIDHLQKISTIDELTKIENRRSVLAKLEFVLDQYQQNSIKFMCMMIDLNEFKQVNDSYGHEVGDNVLVSFSQVLRQSVRDTDYIGRLGGDEFLVIFMDVDSDQVELLTQKIHQNIKRNKVLKKYKVSISYGLAEVKSSTQSVKEIIKSADDQLLKSKQALKN